MTTEIKESNILQIFLKIKFFIQLLKKRALFIIVITILFACIGITISLLSKTKYSSKSTLILEDNKGMKGLDALSNLASQFGMGQGVSVAEEKIIKIFYSRSVTERVLFSTYKKDSSVLVINELIRTEYGGSNFFDGVYFKSLDHLNRKQMMALKAIYQSFSSSNLKVQLSPEGLISVDVTLMDEDLAVAINKKVVQEIESFYMGGMAAKNRRSLMVISNKLDSIDRALGGAEEQYIRYKDANHSMVSARGMVEEMHLRREIEVLNAMRLEAMKSLELNKMNGQFTNSFLRVIDYAKLPADKVKKGMFKYAFIFMIIGLLFSVLYIFISSVLKDLSNQSKGLIQNE